MGRPARESKSGPRRAALLLTPARGPHADRARQRGRRALITGAGGSVGSELARQLASLEAGELILVDASEYALFRIEQELRETCPGVDLRPVLADVTRQNDMRSLLLEARPDVVYHAAAYKHVSMMERDPVSALRTNVLTDPHSPSHWRINGPMSNLEEFQTAWGCSAGDAMVRTAESRVRIW